jgi:hypothetical protein
VVHRQGYPRRHLVDVGIDQRQVCANANAGNDASNNEVGVIADEGVVQGAYACQEQGVEQHIPLAEPIRNLWSISSQCWRKDWSNHNGKDLAQESLADFPLLYT